MAVSYEEASQPRGVSYEEAYRIPPSLGRSAADWATSAIRGLAKGAIATVGQAGDLPQLVSELGQRAGLPQPPQGGLQAYPAGSPFPTTGELIEKIGGKKGEENLAGKLLEQRPETPGGKYAESIGEFAAPSALGKGRVVGKALEAIGGGVGSEAAGEWAQKNHPDHETAARVLGGLFGLKTLANSPRLVTPFPISQERKAALQYLRDEGIEPTAGDISGRQTMKVAESILGDAPFSGGRYAEARERVGRQYTRAVLRRIGEDADLANGETVDRAFTRIGGRMDRLARNDARLDPQYFNDLFGLQDEYHNLFVDPLRKPIVDDVVEHAVNQLLKSPQMTGEQYQALRSRLGRMQRSYQRNDPDLSKFMGDVTESLDDLMERNIRRNNPAEAGAWQNARRQYRNLMVVEKASVAAGEGAAEGIISPASLRSALVGQSRRAYARGQGDFAELSRAGNLVLKPAPSSMTEERHFMRSLPVALGGMAGALHGGATEAIPGIVAGMTAPGLLGRGVMHPSTQAVLGNQIFGAPIVPNSIEALAKSFTASQADAQR